MQGLALCGGEGAGCAHPWSVRGPPWSPGWPPQPRPEASFSIWIPYAWSRRSQSPIMTRMISRTFSSAISCRKGLPAPPERRKLKLKSLPVPIALRQHDQDVGGLGSAPAGGVGWLRTLAAEPRRPRR